LATTNIVATIKHQQQLLWQQPLSIGTIGQPLDSMNGELEVQRVYRMSLVIIGIGLYTYNCLNVSISKFEYSMFTILIFGSANHGCNKIDMDVIVLPGYYQA
jgi:hypothetical protein